MEAEAEAKQETPWGQQEAFEAEQIKKAASRFGAKDRKAKSGEQRRVRVAQAMANGTDVGA